MPVLLIVGLAVAVAATGVPATGDDAPAATGASAQAPKLRCRLPVPSFTGDATHGPRQLTRLPSASLYLTVDRRVEGCPAPIIVRSTISDGS